jgi:hypothetical protein
VVVADDRIKADVAYRLACQDTAMVWRGDFQHARQLLTAMARRVDRRRRKPATSPPTSFTCTAEAKRSERACWECWWSRFEAGLIIPYDGLLTYGKPAQRPIAQRTNRS